MIKDLHIQDYRLFKELNVTNLSQVNLIVGTNNSGKSSLLEAIHIFTNENIKRSLANILNQRGEYVLESPQSHEKMLEIAHMFRGHLIKVGSSIGLKSSSTNTKLILTIARNDTFDGLDGRVGLICELERNEIDIFLPPINLTGDGLLNFQPLYSLGPSSKASQTSKLMSANTINYDELAALWDDITLTPKEDQVITALQILDPLVKRINFISTRTTDSGILVRLSNEVRPVPLGSMGDGMRRILAIIASLVSVGNGNLLIDEIDTGLYYGALKDMWRLVIHTAKQQNAQVFATTHSWDCVRAFQQALAMEEDDHLGRLIRLDRVGEDIRAIGYSTDDLETAIRQGIEVR